MPRKFIGVKVLTLCLVTAGAVFSDSSLFSRAYADTGAAAPIDGGQIYNNEGCAICHKAGLNAAPKYGNKILWGRVVQKGRDTVYQNTINGLRGMPPRGGRPTLTDEQVKAAVDYIVESSGGWAD